MNKDIKKILIVLFLFAFSGGIFYNFQELWMQENNLSINTISTVLSLGALTSVSIIFLSTSIITQEKLKKFIISLLSIKFIIILSLFFLNNSGLNILIKLLIIIEYGIDVEIYASMYPLVSVITKDDKLYAIKDIIYSSAYYSGVLIVGNILGLKIKNLEITYNSYFFIASFIVLIAIFVLRSCKIEKYIKEKQENVNNNILIKLLKKLKKDKISICYILYLLFGFISYYSITGIFLSIIIKEFTFTPSFASNFKLTIGIISVIIGSIILSKFTLKNNYINFLIKFGVRFITYFIAIIIPAKITLLVALLYTIILDNSYTHITDAPYINRFSDKEQLAFANLREMLVYFSRSIGTLICGYSIIYGIRFNFMVSTIFLIPAITFALLAIYYHNKERRNLK